MEDKKEPDKRVEWAWHDVIVHFCGFEHAADIRSLTGDRAADAIMRAAKRSYWKVVVYRSLFCTSAVSGGELILAAFGLVSQNFWASLIWTAIFLGTLSWGLRLRNVRHEPSLEILCKLAETAEQRRNLIAIHTLRRSFEKEGMTAIEDVPCAPGSSDKRPKLNGAIFASDNGLVLLFCEGDPAWVRTNFRTPAAPIRVLWHPHRFIDQQNAPEAQAGNASESKGVSGSGPQLEYETRQLITGMSRSTLEFHLAEFFETVGWKESTKALRAEILHHALPILAALPNASLDSVARKTMHSMEQSKKVKAPPSFDVVSRQLGRTTEGEYGAFRKFLLDKGIRPAEVPDDDTHPNLL